MAIEVIPNPSEELKTVLAVRDTIDKLKRAMKRLEEEGRLVRTILEKHDKPVNENISNLKRRIAQLLECRHKLPLLCNHCNGKQSVDGHATWLKARVCPRCKGTGLEKG